MEYISFACYKLNETYQSTYQLGISNIIASLLSEYKLISVFRNIFLNIFIVKSNRKITQEQNKN